MDPANKEQPADGTGGKLHVRYSFSILIAALSAPEGTLVAKIGEEVEQQHRDVCTEFLAVHTIPDDRGHFEEGTAY